MAPPSATASVLVGAPVRASGPARRQAPQRTDRPFHGISLVIGSTVFLACSDAMAKYLAKSLPPVEVAWIRFVVFVVIMAPALLASRGDALRSVKPGIQVLRGLGLVSSSLFFIWGLRFLPIAEASATAFVAPIFVTALSILILAEKVGVRRWIATLVGLLGVLIVVRPGSGAFHMAALFPIVSAFGWACALVLTRQISGADRPVTTMAYSAVVGFAVLSLLVPFAWVAPTWQQILIGVCIGLSSTAGHWIVVLAYRHADASVLAPFTYTQLLWASALGFVMFAEVPDIWTVIGAGVIISSGLYTAHRERIRKSQPHVKAEPYPSA